MQHNAKYFESALNFMGDLLLLEHVHPQWMGLRRCHESQAVLVGARPCYTPERGNDPIQAYGLSSIQPNNLTTSRFASDSSQMTWTKLN